MAYSKQTWTDDVSAVTGARMTHIEQGIYDNSLATDKIKPSGTATTTAEIEEGQISDVIGFKSLKLKGQTSQGENPSPDSPQDINNVSGDNVIGISNKNIARLELVGQARVYTNGIPQAISGFNGYIANVKPNTTYVSSCQNISTEYNKINNLCYFDDNMNFLSGNVYNVQNKTFTTPANCKYVSMAVNQAIVNFQLEQNSSATSFIAHQGNNFEINLGKNLFNKENIIEGKRLTNDPQNQLTDAEGYYTSSFIKVNPNTTYTKNSPIADAFHRFAFYSSNSESGYLSISNENTIVTPSECKYVRFSGKIDELDTTQLEKGAIATSYAPYFPPIELCKTGTFQDYIYKANGKWYKHKEIEKLTYTGAENWSTRSAGARQLYELNVTGVYSTASTTLGYSNQYKAEINLTDDNTIRIVSGNTLGIHNDTIGSLANFKTFLSNNNLIYYYPLATPIDEEITYAPLLRQLDELYNSGLYDVTNISQDNSSEAFILDIEACKNNINGIVEYIRR